MTTHNFTHLMVLGAEHIAATIEMLEERGVKVFEVSQGGGGLDRHHPQHRATTRSWRPARPPG